MNRHFKLWVTSILWALISVSLLLPLTIQAHDNPVNNPPPDNKPPPPPPCNGGGGNSCPATCSGFPNSGLSVSYYTGLEHEIKTDMVVKGDFPIRMVRQYVSGSKYDSGLGYGWAFNHNRRLFEYPDNLGNPNKSVVIRTGCGINYRYILTAGAYQTTAGGIPSTLVKKPDDSFDLIFLDGRRDHFDSQGNLTETYDTKGRSLRYTYDSRGKLSLIGSSPYGVDPSQPITGAYAYRLTQIDEYRTDGVASGRFVQLAYDNDSTGRISSISSSDNQVVGYVHDTVGVDLTLGNLIQVNGLEGKVTTYKYEDYISGTTTIQDYHNITEIKESTNSTPITFIYDSEDRVIQENYGYKVFSFDWTSQPFQTTITETNTDDAGANLTNAVRVYQFDATGYVTDVTDALGNTIHYVLDSNGMRTKEEYFEEQGTPQVPNLVLVKTIDRTFATNGNKLTEVTTLDKGNTDPLDDETITTTWTYDDTLVASEETILSSNPLKIFRTNTVYNHSGGNPTTVAIERRLKDDGTSYQVTTHTYNSFNERVTTTLPDGHVIENTYGFIAPYSGGPATARAQIGRYHRDDIGGALLTDLKETYQSDSKGNRTHVTDANNRTTVTTYDDLNRRTSVTNDLGHVTSYTYDANVNLTHITRDRTAPGDQLDITRLTYNGENRLTLIERTNAGGTFITRATLRYDSAGNVIARGDALGIETKLTYDLENRLTTITDDAGNFISYSLNSLGQRTKTEYFKTGAVLVRTAIAVFDELDRQEQLIGALSQMTRFTFDAVGNRTSATDALSRPTTVYSYDTLSRLTDILEANNKNTQYGYDDRDQLTTVTDPRSLVTQYGYNQLGQLDTLTSPDTGVSSYTYDPAGNRQSQTDARGITVTYGYDALNRIISKIYPGASNPLNVTYSYDAGTNGLGKLTGMTDAEGSSVYEYDERGNRTKETRTTNGNSYVTQYGYDLNDRLTSVTYPSGRLVSYTRNTLGQVTSVFTTPSGGAQETIASNLTYLPFGTMEDMTWGNGLNLDQSYNQDYLLSGQQLGTLYDRSYSYDAVNNIKTIADNTPAAKNQSFNYDVLDRLDDATGVYGLIDYGYDDVGNRTTKTVDANPVTNYTYSATANQLEGTTGSEVHNFTYDANGNTKTKDAQTLTYDDNNRLIQVVNGANTSTYAHNGKGERTKKDDNGNITLYHYDGSGNLLLESDTAASPMVEYVWLGNQRLAMIVTGTVYYTHTDHLGTPQLMTLQDQTIAWQADYEPFGKANIITASVTNNMRFPGEYYDNESGLHYNYFRDYDPTTGRYVESDPVGLLAGLNTYVYALNNPIMFIDLYGLKCCTQTTDMDCVINQNIKFGDCVDLANLLFAGSQYLCNFFKVPYGSDLCESIAELGHQDALGDCSNDLQKKLLSCTKEVCN